MAAAGMQDEEWDPTTQECPSQDLLDRIGDKWTVLVLGQLSDGAPQRFAQLRDRIDGVSEEMLTQTLRNLEKDGLVSREVFPEVPPRVQYTLTPLGVTLRTPLDALRKWSLAHATDVYAAHERYASKSGPRAGV